MIITNEYENTIEITAEEVKGDFVYIKMSGPRSISEWTITKLERDALMLELLNSGAEKLGWLQRFNRHILAKKVGRGSSELEFSEAPLTP